MHGIHSPWKSRAGFQEIRNWLVGAIARYYRCCFSVKPLKAIAPRLEIGVGDITVVSS